MRALVIFLLFATSVCQISRSVQVSDSGYSFSLEAVKTLKKLMDSDTGSVFGSRGKAAFVCADPDLPREFTALCEGDSAQHVFQSLVRIITPIDPCEICANVACTGC